MKKNVFLTCAIFMVTLIVAGAAQAAVVTDWVSYLSVTDYNSIEVMGIKIAPTEYTEVNDIHLTQYPNGYLGDTSQGNLASTTLTYVGGFSAQSEVIQTFSTTYHISILDPNDRNVGFINGNIKINYLATYDPTENQVIFTIDSRITQDAKSLTGYKGYDYVAGVAIAELLGENSTYVIDLDDFTSGEFNALITMRGFTTPSNNPVPEPTTMMLFGAGLAGLAVVARKRKALKR